MEQENLSKVRISFNDRFFSPTSHLWYLKIYMFIKLGEYVCVCMVQVHAHFDSMCLYGTFTCPCVYMQVHVEARRCSQYLSQVASLPDFVGLSLIEHGAHQLGQAR